MTSIFRTEAGRQEMLAEYEKFLALWPVQCSRHMVRTSQGDTHVIASGDAAAPPLVLLHGSMSNASMWLGDVREFTRRFRVYAVDIIGEAGFSAESRPDLHSEAYALWLDDVLDELGIQHTAMVGISLGAWLALDYAIRRPQRVNTLVVLCPAGVGRQRRDFFFKVLFYMLLGSWGKAKLRELISGSSEAQTGGYAAYMEYLSRLQKHFRPRIVRFTPFSDQKLVSLRMPVLAILGGKDVFFDSFESRQRLESNVTDCTVLFKPEAGHMLVKETVPVMEFLVASGGYEAGVSRTMSG